MLFRRIYSHKLPWYFNINLFNISPFISRISKTEKKITLFIMLFSPINRLCDENDHNKIFDRKSSKMFMIHGGKTRQDKKTTKFAVKSKHQQLQKLVEVYMQGPSNTHITRMLQINLNFQEVLFPKFILMPKGICALNKSTVFSNFLLFTQYITFIWNKNKFIFSSN